MYFVRYWIYAVTTEDLIETPTFGKGSKTLFHSFGVRRWVSFEVMCVLGFVAVNVDVNSLLGIHCRNEIMHLLFHEVSLVLKYFLRFVVGASLYPGSSGCETCKSK